MSSVRVRSVLGQPILALLNAWPDRRALQQRDFQRLLVRGILARAQDLGFVVEEHWLCEPGMKGARMSEILHTRGIGGIIIPGVPSSAATDLDVKWEQFAVVACGRSLKSPNFHRASPALYDSARLAVQAAMDANRTRLGLVLSPEVDRAHDEQWSGAFLAAQRQWPEKDCVPILCVDPNAQSEFITWLEKWRPDTIVTSLNYLPVHEWLKAAPAKQTKRVALIELFRPGRVSDTPRVDANAKLIGAAAVDLLVSQLLRHERGVPQYRQEILVPPTWVSGTGWNKSL
jgi:LacI family transcriptional regulator